MDTRVMELRIKQWIPIMEEQAKSGISKDEWCTMHGINRTSFFRWQKRVRQYLLDQCENQLPPAALSSETDFVEIPSVQIPSAQTAGQADSCTGNAAACVCPPAISIRYGGFSVDLSGDVGEGQLSTVLRAIRHAG